MANDEERNSYTQAGVKPIDVSNPSHRALRIEIYLQTGADVNRFLR